jgi:NAD-dependent SIR2 family protein deacetylase
MGQPVEVACEICGQKSDCVMNSYVDAVGQKIEWQKAVVKPDGIYFAIRCPTCGEREQRSRSMRTRNDYLMLTTCEKCNGAGIVIGKASIKCPACDGIGQILKGTCPAYDGPWTVSVKTDILCQNCEGSGVNPSADPRD